MSKALIAEVRQNVERYIRLMLFAALPIATGGMLLSEQIIRLLAGEQFVPAAPVLSILIWAPALLFIYIPINSLVISQLTKKAAAITGANVVINIAGNIILLPIVGVKAAAIMTVASELLQGSFYFYFVRKNITPFAFLSLAIRPALAALVMGLGLHYFQTPLLMVNIALGAGIYVAALALLGFFRKEDVQFVKTLVKS
jgi:O-antigen/teichoic acid export membrane protein